MRLGLTLPASPREMPTSFLSRLAARNLYLSAANFAADLGLKVNAIACGDPDAVRQLTELAGLPADSFARSTVTKPNSMRYLITGEALQTATFDRGAGHVCPHCLTEDMARDGALGAAVHQWHWQLRHILTCSRHQRRLVVLPASGAEGRYDYVAALRANPDLWKNEPTDPTVPPRPPWKLTSLIAVTASSFRAGPTNSESPRFAAHPSFLACSSSGEAEQHSAM